MKMLVFTERTTKEIIRDQMNLMFGFLFPLIIMLLFTFIQRNLQNELFVLSALTPGIAVFSLSFISLFSGILIAKDRTSSLMLRLFTSPMTASQFIFGYTLPLLPMAFIQMVVCYMTAFALGLQIHFNAFLSMIVLLPAAVLYIAIGLLCGSLFNDKQVSGVCGALLTNVTAWFSGAWIDPELIGGGFKRLVYFLPFAHAVDVGRATIEGNFKDLSSHLWWVIGYALIVTVLAVFVFTKKMRGDK